MTSLRPTSARRRLRTAARLLAGAGIFAARDPVISVVDRVEKANLQMIHPMHGGSFKRDLIPHYLSALRTTPFWYEGKVLGRSLLG